MGLIAKDKGGTDIEPVPAGMHHAICYGVVDLGTQPAFGTFGPKRKVCILFEFPELRIELPDKIDPKKKNNLPRALSIKETLTLSIKGNLRGILVSWRGRDFTQQELDGFDLKNVIGANALCNVTHTTKDNKTYSNISSVTPMMKGMKKRTAETPPLYFSFEDIPATVKVIEVPPHMPDWIKGLIMQSDEWIKRQQTAGQPPRNDTHHEAQPENLDEDVPF